MRKLILATLLPLFFITGVAKSQPTFSHAFGTGFYFSNYAIDVAFVYSPRVNLIPIGSQSTFSVGTNLGLGYGGGYSNKYASSGGFMVDFPVMAALNMGHAADEESYSAFGGFIATGFGLNYASLHDYYGNRAPVNTGLYFNGGIRFLGLASITLQASYMLNFTKGGTNVLGLSACFNFGDWY